MQRQDYLNVARFTMESAPRTSVAELYTDLIENGATAEDARFTVLLVNVEQLNCSPEDKRRAVEKVLRELSK